MTALRYRWLFDGMRAIDYAEPPRYTPREVDERCDRAYAAGFHAARLAALQLVTDSDRHWSRAEVTAEIDDMRPGRWDGDGDGTDALIDRVERGRAVFRCSGCGAVREVASLAACPYPTGGRGPLHRWRPVSA